MRLRRSTALCGIAFSICLLTSCKMPGEKQDISKITDDFVYGSLALSPVSATSAGYHEHHGVNLDQKLDDYSPEGIQQTRQFYTGFRDRLALIKQDELSAEEKADYQILDNQINLAMLELREIQSYRHNPTIYVELVGNALFTPFVLEYAPEGFALPGHHPAAVQSAGVDGSGQAQFAGRTRGLESRGAGRERRQPRTDRQDAARGRARSVERRVRSGRGGRTHGVARLHCVSEETISPAGPATGAWARRSTTRSFDSPWSPARHPSRCSAKPKRRSRACATT